MPLGTPRNTLATEFPLEIVQTAGRVTMLVQSDLSNTEVPRVYLDGRKSPEEPDPSWFGTSVGHWDGASLVIQTVGIETDVIVSGNGPPHSDALRIEERLSVVSDPQYGKVLLDEMTLEDPKAYTEPLKTPRYFTWAPNASPARATASSSSGSTTSGAIASKSTPPLRASEASRNEREIKAARARSRAVPFAAR